MSQDILLYDTCTEEKLHFFNTQLENKDYLEVIKWAYSVYGKDLVYACSFGAEGIVLIDLISKVRQDAKIIFLDTEVHFKETYSLISKVQKKYPTLNIELITPDLSLAEQADKYGEKLWLTNPNLCCQLRKVEPLQKALTGVQAWMSGLRREQSPTRAHLQYINKDDKFQSIKICPLIHWTWEEIWTYIRTFQLPYNDLHDQHYPSIGCEPCTKAIDGNVDSRAGRWVGFEKTECGLHQ